ncbi:HAD hydrolase-like protein [Candidatus Woesearchaeota archaeon]|nr:HAD hydrolase-like protein [Candidatus Woesearchaeota archaeon]
MKNLFVWDFHGVLEKDNEFAVKEVVNNVLPIFGIDRKATVKECLDLYGKKWADYYRYFAPDKDEDTIHNMVEKAVEYSVGKKVASKYIKPMDHAHAVLKQIEDAGHMNIIMSNSNPGALDYFLDSVDMSSIFRYKYAADRHRKNSHEKNSKELWLNRFLEKKSDFQKIVVIDDSPAGIEMGRKLGAVTYHFNRYDSHPKSGADYKISDLREILKEI